MMNDFASKPPTQPAAPLPARLAMGSKTAPFPARRCETAHPARWRGISRGRGRRLATAGPTVHPKLLLTLLVLLAVLGFQGCTKKNENNGNGERQAPPTSGTAATEYVGSQACRKCHEEVYNGWKTTFHAIKLQAIEPDFIIGDFTRNNTFPVNGEPTKMTRIGNDFFVTTMGPKNKLEAYKVKYVIGSIWKQRYITEFPNGALHVLPVQWNVDAREWVAYVGPESFKPDNTAFWAGKNRIFQYECMGCHTTNSHVEYNEESDTYKTSWKEMGVGCEACHGPGSKHLAAAIHDKSDTVFNPGQLYNPRRASMVCGSCHTRGRSSDGKHAFPVDYRPGKELSFLFDENPGVYGDGNPKEHHQQYDDWKASGHYAGGVMCWDCHSVHIRGKFNRFQLKLPGSMLCNTCHPPEARGVHGLHSVNNCIGCHMPNTVKSATQGDLRSHRFIVARPEATVKAGGNVVKTPNSCNLCHYHKEYEPERLVHFLRAVQKPVVCKQCHAHKDEDLD